MKLLHWIISLGLYAGAWSALAYALGLLNGATFLGIALGTVLGHVLPPAWWRRRWAHRHEK